MLNEVTAIIRSVGERTEALCAHLLLQQGLDRSQVHTIRETPFTRALQVSSELGLEAGRRWTLCVDADVLLRPGSIAFMLSRAEAMPASVAQVQGFILDKLFGGPRPAGNHLYRTELLPRFLRHIPKSQDSVRPETHALNGLAAEGYPWQKVRYVVGLHDFGQWHRDIYRKCYVQAAKHSHLAGLLIPYWQDLAVKGDPDGRTALIGFANGLLSTQQVTIDASASCFDVDLTALGLQEKKDVDVEDWSLKRVETIIENWTCPAAVIEQNPQASDLLSPQGDEITSAGTREKMRALRRQKGLVGAARHSVGAALLRLGKGLIG